MTKRTTAGHKSFASTSLVALTVRTLVARDPTLLPPDLHTPDDLANATLDASDKAAIIDYAYRKGGAIPLLEVGNALDGSHQTPALRVLMNSTNTDVLADKWMRLEKYHHSNNRVVIGYELPDIWTCVRQWKGEKLPSDAENILICGFTAGLLRLSGCLALRGSIGGLDINVDPASADPVYATSDTNRWQFHWRKGRSETDGQPPGDHRSAEPLVGATTLPVIQRLRHLLADDVGRVWKIGEAARSLARSPRSLQRDIKVAGYTFSSLVRGVRSQEAGRLLIETETTLSDIGYWCGYADQAHFQRDFRRAVNMTPTQYRALGG